ncbi:MAG TPA: hypothetical protein VFH68_18660 [Polyangia bacterium]|jgi:hypothetical protein|nr:hypothetical protein [Polyangia bacterium]
MLLGLLVLLTHGLFYHQAGWNQNARLGGVFAFVEPGTPEFRTLRIDSLRGGAGRGTGTGDWAQAGDHFYSNKPPGSTLLGILAYLPIHAIESRLGITWNDQAWTNLNSYLINLFVSVFFSALGVVFLFEILTALHGMSLPDALLICAAYGWGTLIFSFDATLWGHPTAAAFVMMGLHGVLRRSRAGAVQAGFALGAAVLVDYVAGVALAAGGLYCLLSPARRRNLGWMVLAALLPLGVLLAYQRVVFGAFLMAATFKQNPQFQAAGQVGGAFGGVSSSVLVKLLFSPYRGAFLFMPVLVFCVPGGLRLWKRDRILTCCCLLAIVGTLLLISSFNGWHGGFSAGPRYLIPALPFCALLLPAFSTLRRPVKWLFGGLLVLSISNALVFCATTSIVPEDNYNPLYGDAYGRAWRDRWSLAPIIYRRR